MLNSIQVKNVALIDSAEIEFGQGLNILTGETGAGKSILLSSVQLALGAKADKNLIRQGAEFASVTLTFLPDDRQKEKLKELYIECEEDGLVLQRRIYPNKSVCKINGETVILKTLQSVAELLIDIHGQREHQAILKASVQEEMFDTYCRDEIEEELKQIADLYQKIKGQEKKLLELNGQDGSSQRELDFAKFEFDEIEKAELKIDEDVILEEQFERLSNAKKITESIENVRNILTGTDNGLINGLSVALHDMKQATDYDSGLKSVYEQLADAEMLLQESNRFLDRYSDRFDCETGELQNVTNRLDFINHLKDKYGNRIEDILQYKDALSEKISQIENREQYVCDLTKQIEENRRLYFQTAERLHEKRVRLADDLSGRLMEALKDLNFEQCQFEVRLEYQKEHMKKNGCSEIAFLISLNKGEALKEMATVASGGELSRIMLAFKTVFADKDQTGTLVFDEIDAGISGKTAWKVSEKLAVLRNNHQVICITHLPQIAAMADTHFCIEKSTTDTDTKTTVSRLDEAQSIAEIGRLLGTDQLTDAVIQNAAEMKKMANQTKQY